MSASDPQRADDVSMGNGGILIVKRPVMKI
jgi:hypothetical protein